MDDVRRSEYDAVIFDLDGVVTDTARVHAAAWTEMLNKFLEQRAERERTRYEPFDPELDYRTFVDGKPRYDGVKSFLDSRRIPMPFGSTSDSSEQETICGLGNRKNELFNELLREMGADVFGTAVDLIRDLRSRGLKTAVVSSSRNCKGVLESVGLTHLFDVRVDGVVAEEAGLPGKPNPDIFLEAARRLDVEPERAVVVEDAISGVQAGRAGNFGLVVGVDRVGLAGELKRHGADIVVESTAEITVQS
jgi:alpha,alpha-trehalase